MMRTPLVRLKQLAPASKLSLLVIFFVSLIQDRCFPVLWEEHIFAFYVAFFSPLFHDNGDRQAECLQAYKASRTHEHGGPGMGKDEHSDNFVRWQMEESAEDKQAHGFVAAHLSGGSWEDVEHVVEGISEDSCPKGDGEANGPEGEHGEKAVKDDGQAGEQHCGDENLWAARANE